MIQFSPPPAAPPGNPGERLLQLEKLCVAADLPAMLACIGDIHQDWDSFSQAQQSDVRKLEAIFLTMLGARARDKAKA